MYSKFRNSNTNNTDFKGKFDIFEEYTGSLHTKECSCVFKLMKKNFEINLKNSIIIDMSTQL